MSFTVVTMPDGTRLFGNAHMTIRWKDRQKPGFSGVTVPDVLQECLYQMARDNAHEEDNGRRNDVAEAHNLVTRAMRLLSE